VSRLEHYTSKCPNKNIIILRDGEKESVGDESRCKSMSELTDAGNVEYYVNGESLVIRRSLNALNN
jgi:hypothetical protein